MALGRTQGQRSPCTRSKRSYSSCPELHAPQAYRRGYNDGLACYFGSLAAAEQRLAASYGIGLHLQLDLGGSLH